MRVGVFEQLGVAARVHHLTAVHTGTGADINNPVCRSDGVFIVLDHYERVAQIAQRNEGVDQAAIVALMQTDAGLVKHVQHAREPGADLRGQADALGFAAGQGAGRASKRQVVEPNAEQEVEAGADFTEHLGCNRGVALGELECVHEVTRAVNRHRAHVCD